MDILRPNKKEIQESALKLWITVIPLLISHGQARAQLMDKPVAHKLHTSLTTTYQQLHKPTVTHNSNTATTLTKNRNTLFFC